MISKYELSLGNFAPGFCPEFIACAQHPSGLWIAARAMIPDEGEGIAIQIHWFRSQSYAAQITTHTCDWSRLFPTKREGKLACWAEFDRLLAEPVPEYVLAHSEKVDRPVSATKKYSGKKAVEEKVPATKKEPAQKAKPAVPAKLLDEPDYEDELRTAGRVAEL